MNPGFYYNQTGPQLPGAGRGMPPAQMGAPPHYMQQPAFRNMPPGADPAAMHRKRMQNKGGTLLEDTDEPSGDELDDISARDIAMARYKRNHDYLSEIFTPYSASSIVPPPLEIPQSKEDLTKLIEEEEKALNERNTKFDERLATLVQKQQDYWRLMEQLDKATDLKQLNETTEQFKRATGTKMQHTKQNVHPVPIPGLDQDEPLVSQTPMMTPGSTANRPSDQQNGFVADFMNAQRDSGNGDTAASMNMFGNFSSSNANPNEQVDDNQNDFFNEMVNTGQEDDDDAGSVSEFLNADMESVGEPSADITMTDVAKEGKDGTA
ncbi:hypothetical protein BJV82DRAFT_606530 [Fennellomyces sp. T-0311]|nr:hypothetical protein BJV82DRAFT_606530 [Fennellomyces sp. T-0311]